jgi:hypothetical protein
VTPKRRRAWKQGLIQLAVAIFLTGLVMRWGASYYGDKAAGFATEMNDRGGR